MQTVTNFNIARLNNAEFTGLQLNFQKAVKQRTVAKLGIDATEFATYEQLLDSLVDQVYVSQSSAYSAEMKELDEKRDNVYYRILLRLELVNHGSDVRSLANAKAAVVTHLLGKYGYGVTKKAYQQVTAIYEGFLMDVRSKLTEDDIETLGIDNDLTALENANKAFINAYNGRTVEQASKEQGVTTRLRQELMGCYEKFVLVTQYFANTTEAEGQVAEAETCQKFIAQLNVLLADAKRLYKRRTGKGGESEDDVVEEPVVDDANPEVNEVVES